jgi:hypothetical protein
MNFVETRAAAPGAAPLPLAGGGTLAAASSKYPECHILCRR